MFCGFAGFILAFQFGSKLPELWRLNLIFGSMLAGIVAIIRINLVIRDRYRCPECDSVVSDHDGVLLDPTACPKCGVRLK